MKKLIAVFLVTISLNAMSQDTSYMLKGNTLYRKVLTTERVNDTASWVNYTIRKEKLKRRARRQNIFAIGAFVIATALIWKP